ncbi:3-methyl-2-oxobutanoate dehydrogenase (2-methylpropanoyl-transferring) subunit alpha [Solimonas sp. K1W22B-7]|nr:3-methyl-2-oxobutanoate dehydrogenase (2-methylpropanoyl-transferring) subunit alpha [Solimonas sp. K1W22B-7]
MELHIPEPQARPGDSPDFSRMVIPPAGSVARPAADAAENSLRELPYQLIRVLDDEGAAVGQWNPELSPELLRRGLRAMLLTRAFDERMVRLQRSGKTSFYIKSTGEEAIGVAQGMALRRDDMCFTSYRQQGLLMAREWPMVDLICQIFNNRKDRLKGRQLPVLYSCRDASYYSMSGNVGSRFPHAVGWAMASAYKRDSRIAAAWIGDGTTAEGDFHYALTFASVYHAPVILNVVNNQWAISTFQGIAGGDEATFASRALGYGLPGLRVDGNDFLAVYAATQWASERARQNLGATLIELYTYRAAAHSTSDDPSKYRPEGEAAAWPLGDPIARLKRHLEQLGEWTDAQHQALVAELDEEVRAAVKEAESHGTLHHSEEDLASLFEDVFEAVPPHLQSQLDELRSIGA